MSLRRAAALALLGMAAPSSAAAQPDPTADVTRAQRAMAQLDFERAIQHLERAEATGRNGREQLLVIYRSLGESRAALGRAGEAETDFRRLLALDPDAELPPGSSPKLTAPFGAARESMRGRQPLAARCERRGQDGAVLSVLSDPVDLVRGARPVRADGGDLPGAATRAGRSRIALAIPPGAPTPLACAVLDRHDNELLRAPLTSPGEDAEGPRDPSGILPPGEAGDRRRPASAEPPPPVDDTGTAPATPLYARWWPWGTAAALAAGAGAYFAVAFQADEADWREIKRDSEMHTYREALEVQERGDRHARYANVAFVASAALVAVSVVLLVREVRRGGARGEPRPGAEAAARVAPPIDAHIVPLPGGAAASLQLQF